MWALIAFFNFCRRKFDRTQVVKSVCVSVCVCLCMSGKACITPCNFTCNLPHNLRKRNSLLVAADMLHAAIPN